MRIDNRKYLAPLLAQLLDTGAIPKQESIMNYDTVEIIPHSLFNKVDWDSLEKVMKTNTLEMRLFGLQNMSQASTAPSICFDTSTTKPGINALAALVAAASPKN